MTIDGENFKALFEKFVDRRYDADKSFRAAKYSLFVGGKRFRFALSQKTAEYYGNICENSDRLSVAIELIHNYSLIHDDLPCMDDSLTRRGNPTCHAEFGAAFATLAGDSLLNLAAEILFSGKTSQEYLDACAYIFEKSGSLGMINGQSEDIEGSAENLEQYIQLTSQKTAMLFSAAIVSQAILAKASKEEIKLWKEFCLYFGIAYQFADDLKDLDEDANKISILSFCNANEAKMLTQEYCDKAQMQLDSLKKVSIYHNNLVQYVKNSLT